MVGKDGEILVLANVYWGFGLISRVVGWSEPVTVRPQKPYPFTTLGSRIGYAEIAVWTASHKPFYPRRPVSPGSWDLNDA